MKSLWRFFRRQKAVAVAEAVELKQSKTFVATTDLEDEDDDWDEDDYWDDDWDPDDWDDDWDDEDEDEWD